MTTTRHSLPATTGSAMRAGGASAWRDNDFRYHESTASLDAPDHLPTGSHRVIDHNGQRFIISTTFRDGVL